MQSRLKAASLAILASVAAFATAAPSHAHPHVFPVVTVTALFDETGRFSGVREKWSFDYDYSGTIRAGIDTDGSGSISPEESAASLQPGGVLNWLVAGNYFTRLTVGGRPVPAGDAKAEATLFAGKLLLEFTVPLKEPQLTVLGAGIDVFDPEFFYDIEFDYPDVEAANAPKGCAVRRRVSDNLDPVAVMLMRRLGIGADPKVISDPAAGYAVRIAINCD